MDYDPAKAARDARKARVAKNEKQHQQNLARAAHMNGAGSSSGPSADRKKQIDRTLAVTRTSTASMGKFDRKLEGEKKLKGVKRKVSSMFSQLQCKLKCSSPSLIPQRSQLPTRSRGILPSSQNWTRSR